VASLAFIGCNNNDNDAKPSDFEGLTLTVPASFIDAAAGAGDATIAFSADGSMATITFPDGTEVDVDVTEGSIVLTVTKIFVNGVEVQSVDLDGDGVDDITVGDTYEFDATIDDTTVDGVPTTVIVLTDSEGTSYTFEIPEGDTGATGTTGG
jgi:hypothetical protein